MVWSDYTWIFVCSIILAIFVAWGIGANDVANSFATSVGSKALSLRQAVIVAAIFEF
ncbi:MAG: phosphate permease, partial [Myxococcales bacterium]|nr:phosphate permease [Myxococcales bacterium]MCP4448365.1 phosphate permease [Myxococcales bacterium]